MFYLNHSILNRRCLQGWVLANRFLILFETRVAAVLFKCLVSSSENVFTHKNSDKTCSTLKNKTSVTGLWFNPVSNWNTLFNSLFEEFVVDVLMDAEELITRESSGGFSLHFFVSLDQFNYKCVHVDLLNLESITNKLTFFQDSSKAINQARVTLPTAQYTDYRVWRYQLQHNILL